MKREGITQDSGALNRGKGERDRGRSEEKTSCNYAREGKAGKKTPDNFRKRERGKPGHFGSLQ